MVCLSLPRLLIRVKSEEFFECCVWYGAQVQNGIFGGFFLPPRLAEILLMVSQSVYGMVVSSVLWRAK